MGEKAAKSVWKANGNMFEAVRSARVGRLTAALDSGADVEARDGDGYTALMMAVEKGHAECVKVLLAGGARVDGRAWVDARDVEAYTALMLAARRGMGRLPKFCWR